MRTRLLGVGIVFLCGVAASAQDAMIDVLTHTPPRVYEGQSVVRVVADSAREAQAAAALAEGLWSEGMSIGRPFDIQIMADRIETLRQAGLEVEVMVPDLQARADADWAVLQQEERLDRGRAMNPARGVNPHDESWFLAYKQLPQIEAYINNLAATRPDLASVSDVGNTIQGRDIWGVTITGPDQPGNAAADRPVVLWNGCQHAREWISPMTVTYIASRLVGDYDSDPAVKGLVDSVRFVIVPVVNPDGYLYSWSTERYWRKNRRAVNLSDFGVDLNRNWGYEWGGSGSSGTPSSDIYRGSTAFSEPETQSLRNLALSYGDDLAAHIDYHSYSQLILWPFGFADGVQTPEPDRTFFDTLATDMSTLIQSQSGAFYNPIQSWELYAASGAATDWFYGTASAKSVTIELRPSDQDFFGLDGFSPPASTILPCAQENWTAAKLFADRTTQRLSISATPPQSVVVDEAATFDFSVSNGTDVYDPASPALFARIGGGAFVETIATPLGGGAYRATLPVADCGDTVEFYVQASTLGGVDVRLPASGAFAADAISVGFTDTMETNTGWTVGAPGDAATSGIWNRMNPQGTTAQPEDDRTPTGVNCWITDGNAGASVGSFDVDGGATTLTSPAIDATDGAGDAQVVYWRWYSNNAGAAPNEDTMLVQISANNGSTWTTLETVSENAGAWVEKRFTISEFVTPSAQVRLRFVARDLINGSIVEAGVDDLRIEFTGCDDAPTADLAPPFGSFDFFDVSAFLGLFNTQDPAVDYDGNGSWNFFDVAEFLALFGAGR